MVLHRWYVFWPSWMICSILVHSEMTDKYIFVFHINGFGCVLSTFCRHLPKKKHCIVVSVHIAHIIACGHVLIQTDKRNQQTDNRMQHVAPTTNLASRMSRYLCPQQQIKHIDAPSVVDLYPWSFLSRALCPYQICVYFDVMRAINKGDVYRMALH